MIVAVETIAIALIFMPICKDMSGKEELKKIIIELEKLNERENKRYNDEHDNQRR